MIIRPERKEDYRAAEQMVRRAFYNRHEPGCSEHYFLHILRDSPDYLPAFSLVAENEGKIVGGIYYSKAFIRTTAGDVAIVTFGPLAVDPIDQNKGTARALFEASLALLAQTDYPAIAIYGEPDYYPRLGFQRAARFSITDPEGNVYDPLMVYELRPDGLKGVEGKLFESPDFEKANDQKAVAEFDALFPPHPKLKFPSQWLHLCDLGQIAKIEEGRYQIQFWEIVIPAELSPTYTGMKPGVGDYVTFRWNPKGLSLIETREIPE